MQTEAPAKEVFQEKASHEEARRLQQLPEHWEELWKGGGLGLRQRGRNLPTILN